MQGQALKYLAGSADLARLDIEAAGLTLHASAGMMVAGYMGSYARGWRSIECEDHLALTISVSALRFKTIVSMFGDEDDVRLSVDEGGMRIRTRSSDAVLNSWGEIADFAELDKRELELAARLPTQALIAEIDAAAEFVSSSQTRPAITGIRLTFSPRGLGFMAFDGGGALYQSNVKAKVKGRGELIVPTQDFLLGAKLIGTEDVIVAKPRDADAIALYKAPTGDALFRSAVIAAEWPDVSKVVRQAPPESFQVDAGAIRNLVLSAKALDGGPDVSVRSHKGYVLFSSQSESGSFTVAAEGAIATELHYDAETLGKVVKLGPVLKFSVPAKAYDATLVESEDRRCWVLTRI